MSQINFLPDSFLQHRRRRRSAVRQYALLAVVAAGMIGWYFSAQNRLERLNDYARSLEELAATTAMQKTQALQLGEREKALVRRVQIQRELSPPIDLSEVIAVITGILPESVALDSLAVTQQPPPIQQPQVSTPSSKTKTKSKSKTKPAPAPTSDQPWHYLNVELRGVAPSGSDMANIVGSLEEHPLFDQVRPGDSRSVERNGFKVSEFAIKFRVPLDRDYQPPAEPRVEQYVGAPGTEETDAR